MQSLDHAPSNTPHFFHYLTVIFLSCLILAWLVYAPGFDFHLPQGYQGDQLFSSMMAKSIIETGWFMHNPALGAPGILNAAEYPMSEGASFLIMRFFSLFSQHYAVVLNCFYFLTYPLTAIFSLYAFKKLGLRPLFAIVASLLFTFLPYHYLRGEAHLYLTALYVIPIYVLMILSVFCESGKKSSRKWVLGVALQVLAIIFAASSGVYYAFFACYLLLITGVCASLSQKAVKSLMKSGLLIVGIIIVLCANILPNLKEHKQNGVNYEIAHRNQNDSELYALKLSQLLLPIADHRVHPFKLLRDHYDQSAPLVNENSMASLGSVAGIGFVLLLLSLFVRERLRSDRVFLFSRLNIAIFLLGTMGGLGALYNYMVMADIRSYNRVSVFIAFFSFFAFFYFLQKMLERFAIKNKSVVLGLATLILVIGILDQVPCHHAPDYAKVKSTWENDQHFVDGIEARLPKESMVFQLPVPHFPESPPLSRMTDYQLFRGYLHSHHLRWSYGAIRGRGVDHWQSLVQKMSVKQMIDTLVYAGFSGVYINREGFDDNAALIEAQLAALLKEKPLTSQDNTLLFFDLHDYASHLEAFMTDKQWHNAVEQVQYDYQIEQSWYEFFYPEKRGYFSVEHWGKEKASLRLVNLTSSPMKVKLHFVFHTGTKDRSELRLSGDVMQQQLSVSMKPVSVDKVVTLTPGPHFIHFETNAPMLVLEKDHPKARFVVSFEVGRV